MNRRDTVSALLALLATPLATRAQQAQKTYRIGILAVATMAAAKPYYDVFLEGLRELGYAEGRNLIVDVRMANGDPDRLLPLAGELVSLKPDVLVGFEAAAIALRAKTTTIPIVMPASTDPVAAGLVRSLGRPGTNVTGLMDFPDQLVAKQFELLVECIPTLSRIAFMGDSGMTPAVRARYENIARKAAESLGVKFILISAHDETTAMQAMQRLVKLRPDALVIATTARSGLIAPEAIKGAERLRLPTIIGSAFFVERGALLSYGFNEFERARYAASFVARIFNGAKPDELPVQQLNSFTLAVNLRTARSLGIKVPQSIMFRADRVIE